LGKFGMLDEALRMMSSRSANEFRRALDERSISMWNVVFADVDGNIGYQYNAALGRRDPSIDWSKPVDGSDPKTRLGPLLDIDELPHIMNPTTRMLVNCNTAPWLTPVGPGISNLWPRYISTY